MSIVRASLSTAFDTTTAPETGSGATGYPTWVEGPNATATTVTTGGTAHTKGSWAEVIASTSADADLIVISINSYVVSTDTATLLDIGVGAAASEVVLVPDIACGGGYVGGPTIWSIAIPISVASGSRIALRAQSVRTAVTLTARITLFAGGPLIGATAAALGTNTGTSTGVEVGTGWTEVVASTGAAYDALVICPSLSTATATVTTADDLIIGTGAASSEVEAARLPVTVSGIEQISAPQAMYGWAHGAIIPGVAAGTRIVAKCATPCDVSFIGITSA